VKSLLVIAGDRALTKFIAETLLARKLERGGPSLKGNGWNIARAHSALEGQLMITRSEQDFDAILVDQSLPDRDVLSFLDQIRKFTESANKPIFVMSERGRDQLTRKLASEAYLVTGFIDKPVTAESLRRGLRNLERMRLVLLVERDKEVAGEFERELRKAAFAVEVTSRAKDAMTIVTEKRPDAVVIALRLDDTLGSELCMQLKRSASTHTIPILLHGSVDDLERVEIQENAHRADDFLREPATGHALVERISALVGRGMSQVGIPAVQQQPPPPVQTAKLRPSVGPATVADQESPMRRRAAAPTKDLAKELESATPPPDIFAESDRESSTKRNLSALRSTDLRVKDHDGEGRLGATLPDDVPLRRLEADLPPSSPPASASPSQAGPAKRSTRRVPCNLSVSFRDGEKIYESETLNISNGGILIATDHPLDIGTHIDLTLELPTTTKPITAVGKVAWIGRAPSGSAEGANHVGVGIKFSRIAPSDLKLIVDYVNSVSRVVYVAP
jgi:uncharacterized protein (TIGR02266 family)